MTDALHRTSPEDALSRTWRMGTDQPHSGRLYQRIYSHESDVTQFSPSGGYERGWDQVGPRLVSMAASSVFSRVK